MSDIQPRPYSKDYEITDAMFGAFRTKGGAKFFFKLAGWATLIFTVLYAVTIPPVASAYGTLFTATFDAAGDPEAAAGAVTSAMLGMTPFLFLMVVGGIVASGVLRAAFFRGYFRDEVDGLFPFRIARDEIHQMLSLLGYYSLFVIVYIGFILLVTVFGGAVAVAGGGDGLALFIILMVLLYVGMFVVFIWYGVTFAPSGALTALRGRVHILAARKITKNRFWALFGALLVAGIIAYVVYYVASLMGLMLGVSGLMDPALFEALANEDGQATLEAFGAKTQTLGFKIGALFAIAMMSFGAAFYSLLIAGPSAYFVRQWDESDPSKVF